MIFAELKHFILFISMNLHKDYVSSTILTTQSSTEDFNQGKSLNQENQ